MKKFAYTVLTAAMVGGVAFGTGGAASAAHCVEGSTPGFSYFGNDHAAGDREAQGSKEGPHGGTSGASNCRDTTGSPSDRAPGKP